LEILDFRLKIKNSDGAEKIKKIIFNKKNSKFENITDDQRKKWKEVFHNIDVDAEISKAECWLEIKQKQYKDYGKFLFGWLGRAKPNFKAEETEAEQLPGCTSQVPPGA
jgi:hypothetical protein